MRKRGHKRRRVAAEEGHQTGRQREKTIHVLLIESESQDTINEATRRLSGIVGVNYMHYSLGDAHLRVIFSALRQAAVS